ncbi:hypothetical protein BHU72_13130 [Desulfuribacillus stibiiarsenatis]|uniref:ATP-grasp domain-containing protein n=1 Tax=Desulfuribacillus stibiiarsenatis TaxID=1390249 RepID=A0A1E5L8U2_9FIRM|nr:YheC/YheD family protein [Desulfuribacillus stibiiarsenatis]OEH86546.1 hypothetical protein BHU72_13130 [Desulfuribacillus stibiiarsenatis]
MGKPYLGILIGNRDRNAILNGEGYEKVDLYLDAAKKYGLQICFFRFNDIDMKSNVVIAKFPKGHNTWTTRKISVPKVIHNRAVYGTRQQNQIVKLRKRGFVLFNGWNTYSKLKIHQLLEKHRSLKAYSPITRLFTKRNLNYFCRFSSFFLKPDRGAVGKGIVKLSKVEANLWRITHQNKNRKLIFEKTKEELFDFLVRYTKGSRCILQQTIVLQTYNKRPFDIRVSVQKNFEGKWQVTGMVAKVAGKGHYLSNVFQGGTVKRLDEIYWNSSYLRIKNKISTVALQIIRYLEKNLSNLSDVGFDFGVDDEERIYFIEMNSRDQRYSFLLAGMEQTFQETYENPIAYGKYLISQNL